MSATDGGMLRSCQPSPSICSALHGEASSYGHRPVGTLAEYLGVGTAKLMRAERLTWAEKMPDGAWVVR